MRISVAQLNYHIGNFESNLNKILAAVEKAKDDHCDLIVFSELAVCGYPPRDFLEFDDFIERCLESIERIRVVADNIAIIVGCPSKNPKKEGKDLFNSAYFIHNKEVKYLAHKALLPTYDIFDEYRYFEPCESFHTLEFMGKRLAITICEDIWNIGNENPLYDTCPMDHLIKEKPDLMINLSASPFSYDHANIRTEIVRSNTAKYGIPMIYVNQVGAQTEIIFDGGSLIMGSNNKVFAELPYFKEYQFNFEFEKLQEGVDECYENEKDKMALIHDALVLGIKDYFKKLGFTKAVLGLSGGIDSALTLVLACRALGPENVLSVMMPSEFSSAHSLSDSEELCKNLGSPIEKVPISQTFRALKENLSPQFKGHPENIAEENMQARIRGVMLMAFSNKFGYILLNTSNKSEMAVGYGTMYGDMCGGISVIGDLYKTKVYDLARYINAESEIIPEHILSKPPSAELRPDQKDSDSLPDYDILDKILYQYIEMREGPEDIIAMGFEEALVTRILQMVNRNEWKRYQTAPMLRVSNKSFGMGRRMPIVAKYLG